MSEERLLEPEPKMSESKAEPKKGRHLQTGVRTLIVLVATLRRHVLGGAVPVGEPAPCLWRGPRAPSAAAYPTA